MNTREEITAKFRSEYIEYEKTDPTIRQLNYMDFGEIDWVEECLAGTETTCDDFLKRNKIDAKSVSGRHVVLGFSENGENLSEGHDYIIDNLIIVYERDRQTLKVYDQFMIEHDKVVYESKCDDELWEWLTEHSFFVDGSEF